jgi:hypothetical protein
VYNVELKHQSINNQTNYPNVDTCREREEEEMYKGQSKHD